ncbi:MAG: hypothetical protein HPY53_01390 [Brevinematales bacterium]|nr:hypothetical protein [Brevinematales bacterium]
MKVSWDDTKNERGSYELPPEGTFPAIIFGIWDVGIQAGAFGERQKFAIGFEIVDGEGKHYERYKLYTPSLVCYTDKSGQEVVSDLRRTVEALINRPLAERAEEDPLAKNGELDLDQFIGRYCLINVTRRWNKARTKEYADLKEVFPFPRNYQRFAPNADYGNRVPKYIQTLRDNSLNHGDSHGDGNNGNSRPAYQPQRQVNGQPGAQGNGQPTNQRPNYGRQGNGNQQTPGNGNGNGQVPAGKRHLEYTGPRGAGNSDEYGSMAGDDGTDPNEPQF